jgi:hypothetical protein
MERAITIGLVSFLVLVVGAPNSVGAESAALSEEDVAQDEGDEEDGWGVSLSVGFDVLMQETEGGFTSNLEQRSQADPSASGSEFFVNPLMGGGSEVMTPVLLDIPGKPRLYFGAGIRYSANLPHTLVSSGDRPLPIPEESEYFAFDTFRLGGDADLEPPVPPRDTYPDVEFSPSYLAGEYVNPDCPDKTCPKEFIPGQGTRVAAVYEPLFWQTELGFVFSIPLEERTLLIKPAVGYIQQQMKVTGETARVYREVDPNENPVRPGDRDFVSAEFGGTVKQTFRSLGPKVMVELDASRFKSMGQRFGASIFADFGVFWMLSNPLVEFSGEQLVSSEDRRLRPNGTEGNIVRTERFGPDHIDLQRADYFFEMDKLSYRFGVGFRLTWYPN